MKWVISRTEVCIILFNQKIIVSKLSKNMKKDFPIPGVEPGPAGWKPAILAVRPYGMRYWEGQNKDIYIKFEHFIKRYF